MATVRALAVPLHSGLSAKFLEELPGPGSAPAIVFGVCRITDAPKTTRPASGDGNAQCGTNTVAVRVFAICHVGNS